MDTEPSAPETSQLPNSSGSSSSSSSSSPRSRDSDIDVSIKDFVENGKTTSSSSESSSDSEEDEGFVSGGEEFVEAPERPIQADPDEDISEMEEGGGDDDDDGDAPFVDSSEFSMPIAMPVAQATVDSDDDDDIIGGSKGGNLGAESGEEDGGVEKEKPFEGADKGLKIFAVEGSGENVEAGGVSFEEKPVMVEKGLAENGGLRELMKEGGTGDTVKETVQVMVSGEQDKAVEAPKLGESGGSVIEDEGKIDVLAGEQPAAGWEGIENREVVEDGTSLSSGIDKVDSVEPDSDKLGEPEVEFTEKGDSVVEAIHVDLLASGAAVVGDVEENKYSELKDKEVLVGKTVSLDNGFEQISPDAEAPVVFEGGVESEKIGGPSTVKIPESTVDPNRANRPETDASAEKDNDSDMSAAVDVATKDIQDFVEMEASADESQNVDLIIKEEKPVTEVDPKADSETQQSEPVVDRDATGDAEHTEDNQTHVSARGEQLDGLVNSPEPTEIASLSNSEAGLEAEDVEKHVPAEEGEIEGSVTDEEAESTIFGSSEAAKQFLEELERRSGGESSHDHSQRIDGQIVTDSDEEVDTDEEEDGKELFDSAALAALLKAATGADSDGGNITITSQDGSRLFSVERPAGLGSSLRSVKPAPRSNRSNLFTPSSLPTGGDSENNLSEEERRKLEKLQQIRVKFLRLVQRLGHSPEDQIAAQVLYRLALVAGRQTNQLFSLDAAKRTASQLEVDEKDDLNFSLNILVLGKTGAGKSSTINSIFGEERSKINAFECATTFVKEISGTVDGVKIRVFDTPGLKSSVFEQCFNQKVLSSIKKFTKKCPPDIVLYVDRLDTQTRDLNDLPLLKTITSTLGPSIWRSAIVTLTHAACAPPDGPLGNSLSYETFVAQRSHIVQQSIGQAVGDLRMMNPSSMNPVSLVENHPSCRRNREGLKVLPNGQSWKPQLLFLCYSMKILSEASSLSKPQDPFDPRKLFGFRVRSPPLPYLLSGLLQSRTHPKLMTGQSYNDVDSDIVVDDSDQENEEDEDEYDKLPPFRPLKKAQIAQLSREQRNAYFDEYEYRVKLLQKKQWREMKKGKVGNDDGGYAGEGEGEGEGADPDDGTVATPLPDMVLPHSFDSDNPTYRYRFMELNSQILTRPVLDTHGWDHDCGYDGVNFENRALAIASRYPASVAVQMTKDKKEFNIHLDSSVSAKHGEKGSSMVGFDIQNIGKQLAYIVRGETKFKNFKRNKTAAGASLTFLGENVATGLKVEDQIALGKRLMLVGSTGTVRSRGDSAYGANLEVQLRDADYPIGQDQSSLALSLVKWRGDLALGANFQSQISIGRGNKVTVRAGLNNKRSGQISITLSSSEQLQLALVGLIPLVRAIYKSILPGPGAGESYSIY